MLNVPKCSEVAGTHRKGVTHRALEPSVEAAYKHTVSSSKKT